MNLPEKVGKMLVAHYRNFNDEKIPQSLWQHLENVSNFSALFAEKINLDKVGKIVGLLHDIGKASKDFQNYIQSAEGLIDPDNDEFIDAKAKKGKIDHSSAGAQIAYRSLFNLAEKKA
jgi:CRISPR-associated endonuclease/helicase Cas3